MFKLKNQNINNSWVQKMRYRSSDRQMRENIFEYGVNVRVFSVLDLILSIGINLSRRGVIMSKTISMQLLFNRME